MVPSERTPIEIASAAHRVLDASVAYSRGMNDQDTIVSRARLEGELHRIIAASRTILKEILQPPYSRDSAIDDRLSSWLTGDEPQACLDSLNLMEKVIRSVSSNMGSTFRNMFRSSPSEGKVKEAIRIFEKRRDCFHFLLTTDIWNHETVTKAKLRVSSSDTQGIGTQQAVVCANRDASVETVARVSGSPVKGRITWEIDQTQLYGILRWLDAWDCATKHEDTLELRQPDTCTWLSDTDEYRTWRSLDNSFLWLHGKPGSGKSVLAAYVIDSLKATLREGELLAFFYCDFRNERSTTPAEVMRSLLSQLLQGCNDLGVDPGDILRSLDKEKGRPTSTLGSAKPLAQFVSRAAKRFPIQPFFVIDALDECKDVESLLQAIRLLNQGGIRLLVVSRPLQVIKDSFSGLVWLCLEDKLSEVSADINLHVKREIDSHRRLRIVDGELKEEITRKLGDKADGMLVDFLHLPSPKKNDLTVLVPRFRWIQCQLDTLKRCVTAVKVRETLESLPIGLDATYDRILLEMNSDPEGKEIARRALAWFVVALAPLRLSQILEAMSIDVGGRTLDPDRGPVHGQALLDTLGSLVTHDGETDIVKLSHFSVKEYLVGNILEMKYSYIISEQDAHAQVARQCMTYMAVCLEKETLEGPLPLLDYVLLSGFNHLSHVKPTKSILSAIMALHSVVQQHPSAWELMCDWEASTGYYVNPGLPRLEHDFVLYILIGYAPEPLLRTFLGRVPVRAKLGTNPLIYTARRKVEHARTLLLHGAKLDLCGKFIYTYRGGFTTGLPIEAAVWEGNCELVKLFIAEGSPIPQRLFPITLSAEYITTPAQVVVILLQTDEFAEWVKTTTDETLLLCALNHEKYHDSFRVLRPDADDVVIMTRRLSQTGSEFPGADYFHEMVLRQAAYAGHVSTIKYFLSAFNVSLPSNILLDTLACGSPDTAIIRFLLRYAPHDLNHLVSDDDESTALHHAMHRNFKQEKKCLESIKILCEAGCDPSARNLHGKTPMHHAAQEGYISVVKYLLFAGAPLPPDILLRGALEPAILGTLAPDPAMIRFLLAEGADARAVAPNGDTTLHLILQSHWSKWYDCVENVKMLIDAGCDPYTPDSAGQPPIVLAVLLGHVPVVKYLLSLHISFPPDIFLFAMHNNRMRDKLPMIKFLLDYGADVHVTQPVGGGALHSALSVCREHDTCFPRLGNSRCLQIIKTLLDAGCDPSTCNSDGKTLLHHAARCCRFEVIEHMLFRGLSLPSDVLLHVLWYPPTNSQAVQFLINSGADVRAVTSNGNTPLHLAIQSQPESHVLEIAQTLIRAGSDPNALNSSHKTPLHVAVGEGHTSVVNFLLSLDIPLPPDILLTVPENRESKTIGPLIRLLIERGANTTSVTSNGDTALHLALARKDHDDCVEIAAILTSNGCNIHSRNSAGDTPLHVAARAGHIAIVEHYRSQGELLPADAILKAVVAGHVAILRDFLLQGGQPPPSIILAVAASLMDDSRKVALIGFFATLDGVDIQFVDADGNTALHHAVAAAVYNDRLKTTEFLLGLGCNPTLRNLAGETPLHIAVKDYFGVPVVKYLLSQGIPLPFDILSSAASADASGYFMIPMMRLLIREGADPCAANDAGDTPLHIVLQRKSLEWEWECVQTLLEVGGDPDARNHAGETPFRLAEAKGPRCAQNFVRLVKNAQKKRREVPVPRITTDAGQGFPYVSSVYNTQQ